MCITSGVVYTPPSIVVLALWLALAVPDDISVRHSQAAQKTATGHENLDAGKEMTMTKTFVGSVIALGAAVAIAAAVPAQAHANVHGNGPFSGPKGDHDASAYWVDISDVFPSGSVDDARGVATIVCAKLQQGVSEGDLIAAGASGGDMTIGDVRYVVDAAEWHFCPAYY